MQSAFDGSRDRDSLLDAFGHHNLELYVRGKTLGVIDHDTGKKHRLKTLDLEMADRVEIRLSGQETGPEKAAEREDAQEQVYFQFEYPLIGFQPSVFRRTCFS